MAVAVRPVRRPLTALPAPIERAGLAAWPLLAALISLNVVVRTALGWLRETPIYLGDEYLYADAMDFVRERLASLGQAGLSPRGRRS